MKRQGDTRASIRPTGRGNQWMGQAVQQPLGPLTAKPAGSRTEYLDEGAHLRPLPDPQHSSGTKVTSRRLDCGSAVRFDPERTGLVRLRRHRTGAAESLPVIVLQPVRSTKHAEARVECKERFKEVLLVPQPALGAKPRFGIIARREDVVDLHQDTVGKDRKYLVEFPQHVAVRTG